MPRLRRVDCASPGIARHRHGRGFTYVDESGGRVRDPAVVERIRGLAIPPAWEDVWICADPLGHLQAVGTDARGRRQYLYHARWRERRDREKFDRILDFARLLPAMRETADAKLRGRALTEERVLFAAVRLLDRGFFRIGGEEYTENGSFGLATLERRHVRVEPGGLLVFEYPGKTGKRHEQHVVDPAVHRIARGLLRRRGRPDGFLAYRDGGTWVDVRSADINAFVKDLLGPEFSAKDFRTWHATVLAGVGVAVSTLPSSETGRRRAVSRVVSEVAHYLGNTPAVCRTSYIDPRIFDRYRAGATIKPTLERLAWPDDVDAPATQGPIEQAVIELLG